MSDNYEFNPEASALAEEVVYLSLKLERVIQACRERLAFKSLTNQEIIFIRKLLIITSAGDKDLKELPDE